jgi:hypothetical protein
LGKLKVIALFGGESEPEETGPADSAVPGIASDTASLDGEATLPKTWG